MAAFWFENVAHQTVATAFVLRVTQMEPPENRYLAWVRGHGLREGPNEHDEEDVENGKQH